MLQFWRMAKLGPEKHTPWALPSASRLPLGMTLASSQGAQSTYDYICELEDAGMRNGVYVAVIACRFLYLLCAQTTKIFYLCALLVFWFLFIYVVAVSVCARINLICMLIYIIWTLLSWMDLCVMCLRA